MSKRIIISVTNDLSIDQRVHRVAKTLHEAGHDVLVVGRKRRASVSLDERPYRVKRLRMLFDKGKLFYAEHAFRLFWFLLFRKADIYLSNDLDTLLANYWASFFRRKTLVYDTHEYWTEIPELLQRPGTRKMWLRLEKWLFPRVDKAYTVNQSIADIYSAKYGLEVVSIRNLPLRKPLPPARAEPGNILLYQGALNVGRGVDLMIKAMHHLPEYRLWIIGFGTEDQRLPELMRAEGLEDRVKFFGFVPFAELSQYTVQAAVGLSLEADMGASYHYALPNKVFDYVQARVPVIASDLPEMKRVVEAQGIGRLLPADRRTPEALAELVRAMCADAAQWQTYRQACDQAAGILCWEREKGKLLEIFD